MGTRWVQRVGGKIVGSFANPQPGFAEEEIDDASQEHVDFWTKSLSPPPASPTLGEVYAALKDKLDGKPGADAALAELSAKFDAAKTSGLARQP